MSKARFQKISYDIPCQSFGCTDRALWMVTSHEEALINASFLCEGCAESLFASMLESDVAKRVLDRLAQASRETPPAALRGPVSVAPTPKAVKPEKKPQTRQQKPKKSGKPKPRGGAKSAGRAPSAPDQASKPT